MPLVHNIDILVDIRQLGKARHRGKELMNEEKAKKVAPAPDLDFPSLQPSRQPSQQSKTEKKPKPSKKNVSSSEPSPTTPPSSSLRSAADLIFCDTNGNRSESTTSQEMKENVPKVNLVKQLPVQPKC